MKDDKEANYPMASRSAPSVQSPLLSDEVEWFSDYVELGWLGGTSFGVMRGA